MNDSMEVLRESEYRYRSLFENSKDGVFLSAPDGRVFAANQAASHMFGRTVEECTCAEEQLRASESRYRTLVENIGDTVYITDIDGSFTFVTPQAEQLTGYTQEELLRMSYRDLIDPDCLSIADSRFSHVVAGATLEPVELVIRHADGRPIPIEAFSSRLRGEPDDTTIAVQGLVRDITRRKQAEAERTLLATAIQQASEGVIITDASGNVLYANPAFEQMSGFAHGELLERNISLVQSSKHPDSFHQTVRDTLARGEVWKGHFINQRKDGGLFEVSATIYPIRDRNGTISHHVALECDVTHAVQLEKQLRRAQKIEAVGTLASGMAHDFNNMLATAIGQAQLAADVLPEGHPTQRNLDLLLQACHHAKDLLRQILALGRSEGLECIPVALPWMIQEVLKLLAPNLADNVTVQTDETSSDSAFTVLADPTQMQQVLMNLCTNALYAMQRAGGILRVSLGLETIDSGGPSPHPSLLPGTYVRMTVSDTGRGIDVNDPDIMEKIFDPFFTTKPAGHGTGLGLAVVYAIVVNHGGAITVQSELGVGTQFHVYLPQKLQA